MNMITEIKALFVDAVRRTMENNGWNQSDLAVKVYGSAETKWRVAVSRVLNGDVGQRDGTMDRWCKALGIQVSFKAAREKISA